VRISSLSPNRWSFSSPAERADQRTRQAPNTNTVITVFITASSIERNMRMTATNPIHDHYTVISRVGDFHASRVVIAGSPADAAETHREHYPARDIIRVLNKATAPVKLTA
jgi:hypothetical protein